VTLTTAGGQSRTSTAALKRRHWTRTVEVSQPRRGAVSASSRAIDDMNDKPTLERIRASSLAVIVITLQYGAPSSGLSNYLLSRCNLCGGRRVGRNLNL